MEWKEWTQRPEKDLLYVLVVDAQYPDDESISAQYSKVRDEFYNINGTFYLPVHATHWCEMPTFNDLENKNIHRRHQYDDEK